MTTTERLGLPLLAAGQAQKELTHNEALSLIDLAVARTAESADLATPPASPLPGQCWIVPSGGSDAWDGRDQQIAGWTVNGWRFIAPRIGWSCQVLDRGHSLRFDGSIWLDEGTREDGFYVANERIIGPREAPIANPDGGSTIDTEARDAINGLLSCLRSHGLIAT